MVYFWMVYFWMVDITMDIHSVLEYYVFKDGG